MGVKDPFAEDGACKPACIADENRPLVNRGGDVIAERQRVCRWFPVDERRKADGIQELPEALGEVFPVLLQQPPKPDDDRLPVREDPPIAPPAGVKDKEWCREFGFQSDRAVTAHECLRLLARDCKFHGPSEVLAPPVMLDDALREGTADSAVNPVSPDEDPGGIPVPVRCRDGAAGVVDCGHLHALVDLCPGLSCLPGKAGIVTLSVGEIERLRKVPGEDATASDIKCIVGTGRVEQPLLPEGGDGQVKDAVEKPDGLLAETAPADFTPGVSLLLDECHPVSESREQAGGGAPGGPPTDNDGVISR
ncbi:hypothetical protein DSECCO2_396530 [anaerobic digester metagenome]